MDNQFSKFSFRPVLTNAIEQLNFYEPTAIQQQVIPAVLEGTSVIGQSETGSGKTHAYLLPLLNQISTDKQEIQFVMTAPTRELAMQIYEEVRKIIDYANMRGVWNAKLLVGGTDKQKAMEKLKRPPHIIIGTPGRILDMIKEEAISIYTASAFVIDEADLMLDLGFIRDVDQLLVRSKENIQILAFSATIPQQLEQFYRKYLENPLHIKMNDKLSPETLEHRLIPLKHRDASNIILEISKAIQPYLAIIFANGKEAADTLASSLQQKGLDVGIIHGGLTPRERKRTLKEIQNLRYQYIVATDLASRGIDIKGVSHVINAQLPKEEDFYVHRSGRTARAGMEGTVISLYGDQDKKLIEKLQQKGISFTFWDVKDGEWKESKSWNERNRRQKTTDHIDSAAWKQVKKSKTVKPGYKKKMKKQQEQIKNQMKRKSNNKRK
ncbi:DEAD-box ATP-dependent RNA helicase CshB [Lentibacillus kapialis]|uniref:DEAD-box ATP-dependent RNA helicase CshB n=1 Tax=Lentibacillus kapialis TaxID=340214 RepID=A0A917PKZ7_9BACI|nr:DEAD/DEAH box helicase [Lentibacillus kapialis]GGJ83226.1 DEAD-box ATP-dependent RNA helicase CshB [Lentibacillus kapialis]